MTPTRVRLLADARVRRPRDLAAREQVEQRLLEAPDQDTSARRAPRGCRLARRRACRLVMAMSPMQVRDSRGRPGGLDQRRVLVGELRLLEHARAPRRGARAARPARRRGRCAARAGRCRGGTPPPRPLSTWTSSFHGWRRTASCEIAPASVPTIRSRLGSPARAPRRAAASELPSSPSIGAPPRSSSVGIRSTRLTGAATTVRLDAGRGEDQRHLDDLVEERRAVHVVRPLDVVLVGEPLAPRLAVVGDERERRVVAQAERVELAEEPGEEVLRRALDRLGVRLAQRLERARRCRTGFRSMISSFAAFHSLRSAWSTSYGMCVAQLWNQRTNGRSRCSRSQATAPSSVSLVPATFASAKPLEEVVLVEDEAAGRRSRSPRRRVKSVGMRRVERRVPVEVAVVVRVEAGDHRRRRRARPRRGGDRLVEPRRRSRRTRRSCAC